MKYKKILFVLIIALATLALIACTTPPAETEETPEEELPPPEIEKVLKVVTEDDPDNDSIFNLVGIVKDGYHNTLADVELYFGEDNSLAATTNQAGEFSFYFQDTYEYSSSQQLDYLILDNEKYNFFIAEQGLPRHPDYSHKVIECIVVAALVEDNINLATQLHFPIATNGKFSEIRFNVRYGENGIELPEGATDYMGVPLPPGDTSVEGRTPIIGVKLYIGDTLVTLSEARCAHLDYLLFGTEIRFEAEGFTFHLQDGSPLANNTYTFTQPVPEGFQIRGFTKNEED